MLREDAGVSAILLFGRMELAPPPGLVCFWNLSMPWAELPEAAINDHGNRFPGEKDVCLTAQIWQEP